MSRQTILLSTITLGGLAYSIYRLVSGQGGSGLGDFFDALAISSIILFITACAVILVRLRTIKTQPSAFLFLAISLPFTITTIRSGISEYQYNRQPNLTPRYVRPVSNEQYLSDSNFIISQIRQLADSDNKKYGNEDILSTSIDTIIYSQTGDQVFVSYIRQYHPNNLDNGLYPTSLVSGSRKNGHWQLRTPRYVMGGSFDSEEELKKEVRKFYFNRFKFSDRDILSEHYFWKAVP